MTEENDELGVPEPLVEDELTVLKRRADMMGLKYHPSIGAEKLKEKIETFIAEQGTSQESTEIGAEEPTTPGEETAQQKRARLRKEAMKLVRVRISCNNPNKGEWEGEIFTVGNNLVGTLKKYVPFNVDWHVPQMMLNMIEERQCQVFRTIRDHRGNTSRQGQMIKEFNVQKLPDLTPKELKELAQRQAMASGTAEAAA